MTPPRHGQAGRQWPLQRPGILTARLALLKSVCEVLVNGAVGGGTFWRKPHSRLHECFRWSSLLVRGSRSAARCRGSSGHGAALLAAVASGFQPGQNLLATPRPSQGGSSRASCPSNSGPCGPKGKRPSAPRSHCTYFQRSPDGKTGGQPLWASNQDASCPPRTQAHGE